MSFSLPPPGQEGLLLIVVLIAAIYDLRYRRIPNWRFWRTIFLP